MKNGDNEFIITVSNSEGDSIDYKLINDDTTYQTSSNFDIESPNYVGIMLLEVFFPDSTWN